MKWRLSFFLGAILKVFVFSDTSWHMIELIWPRLCSFSPSLMLSLSILDDRDSKSCHSGSFARSRFQQEYKDSVPIL